MTTPAASVVLNLDDEVPADNVAGALPEGEAVADIDDDAAADLPARAQRQDDGTIVLPLRRPVTMLLRRNGQPAGEQRYAALRFGRLNGAAMRAINAVSDSNRVAIAIGKSAGLRDGVALRLFDEMDAADIADAGKIITHFLG